MNVSVVIAVYNAEQFVATAIESALAQPETAEVVLVEDGSPDQSLRICESYAASNDKVKIFRHPIGENRGAGASFNLGIRKASQKYVAILGADDQYVPGAFKFAADVFASHPDADGAYAHIGVKYYDAELRVKHLQRVPREISGMFDKISPEDLLCALLSGKKGHFSLDSLVMKRDILTQEYLFDETLRLGQDTDFIYRLSSAHRLYGPEETTIVALRGVHEGNRVWDFDKAAEYRRKLLLKCMRNNFYGCSKKESVKPVINRYLRDGFITGLPVVPLRLKRRLAYLIFLWTHPAIHRVIRKCS